MLPRGLINVPSSDTVQNTGLGFPPFAPIFILILTGSVMFDTSLPTAVKNMNRKLLPYLSMNAVAKNLYH